MGNGEIQNAKPRARLRHSSFVIRHFIALLIGATLCCADEKDAAPQQGKFPAPDTGRTISGELVSLDHVNRRGALRLDGDGVDDRYHSAPSHQFAMLPYGTLRYHGAPAELRDIPIGTHLHGTFFLPPEGDTTFPVPKKDARYVLPQNHALTLEDDFSFYARRGQTWKITSLDLLKDQLKAALAGPPAPDGLSGEKMFELDRSTRVWKGRGFAELEDIAAGQIVQINLTWAPDWKNGQFHLADIWLDEESRKISTERQRQIHLRHAHHRWLAGWVDFVEHQPGGKGVVTLTLFGGMDPSLYDEVRKAKAGAIAAGEKTLRTWWQEHDSKGGPVLDFKDTPNPPPGSSGLQLRVQIAELLEGFRPGRIVRFRPNGWPNVKLPPEERVKSLDDR